MQNFTDLAFAADDDGIYDLVIDAKDRDFKTTAGLESASFVSLFSDRRARADEVADPMKRRGWIGNLVSDVPGDNFGSGLWLYEQRRLTLDVIAGVRIEAEQSHTWMVEEGLAKYVTASITSDPVQRSVNVNVTIAEPQGNTTTHAFPLIQATKNGLLATS